MDTHPTKRHKSMAAGSSQDDEVTLPPTPTRESGNSYAQLGAYDSGTLIAGNIYNYNFGHSAQRGKQHERLLLDSLSFPRMHARRDTVLAALPTTCNWLFQHCYYTDWIDDGLIQRHHGLLWVKGNPGTGKTTLLKLAHDHASRRDIPSAVVSYFFNARAPTELEKSVIGLYRSLTYQILDKLEDVRTIFVERFQTKVRLDKTVEEWSIEELQVFLIDILKSCNHLRIEVFIDALDEGEVSDIRELVRFLVRWTYDSVRSSKHNLLRVFFSSRHYPEVIIRTKLSFTLEQQSEHYDDLDIYIRTSLQVDDPLLTEQLCNAITKKARGLFLWTVLVIGILNDMYADCCDSEELLNYIQSTPAEMLELYRDLLFNRPARTQLNRMLFLWVLLSTRQLTPEELYLLAQPSVAVRGAISATRQAKEIKRYIIDRSRGLIEVVENEEGREGVQFIHETVRDFLLQNDGLAQLFPEFRSNIFGFGHEALRNICLEHLQHIAPDLPQTVSEAKSLGKRSAAGVLFPLYPTLHYCTAAVFEHANLSLQHGLSQHMFLRQFQDAHSKVFTKWLEVFGLLDVKKLRPETSISGLSLLYVLIVGCPQKSDSRDGSGNVDVVHTLLELDVNINEQCGRLGNALQAAVYLRKMGIVQRLLANGANVHAEGGTYEHALGAALMTGSDEMVKLVLHCRASSSPALLWKCLTLALSVNSTWRVRLLIEKGVVLNGPFTTSMLVRGYKGEHPLICAAAKCTPEIVKVLLDGGADPNLRSPEGNTSLLAAAAEGRLDNVTLLAQHDAQIDFVAPQTNAAMGGTALHTAIMNKHNSVACWLIDSGAELNISGWVGTISCHALQAAIFWNNNFVARYLVEKGAGLDSISDYYGSPLHTAAMCGNLDMVRFLLERGADVNLIGGAYGNALQAALDEERKGIAQMLLDWGATRLVPPSSPSSAAEQDEMERGAVPPEPACRSRSSLIVGPDERAEGTTCLRSADEQPQQHHEQRRRSTY